MNWMKNKNYCNFVCCIIYAVSALITAVPIVISALVPDSWWIPALFVIPCALQAIFVATPIISTLKEYQRASSKRGLLLESDVYNLFEQNGTAKLHVADIDKLPRYNVEIPETKFGLTIEEISIVEDSSGTERIIERGTVTCFNCETTFGADVIEDPDFKHCPCCGNRITRFRVPRDWYNRRQEEKVTDANSK